MTEIRTDWTRDEIAALFDLPFNDLLFQAQTVHRQNFDPNAVQLSTLLSIKTGGCVEDCGYCSQSASHDTGLKATKLMDVRAVLQAAAQAKDNGSGRFCMGAAWRSPKDRDMPAIIEMVKGVRAMGMETCMTLGMLSQAQAAQLAEAGLDYYNHNIDTSPENYANVISTRSFEDRIDTLETVRAAGINVCSGGIVGMGETRADRIGFLHALATMADQRAGAGEGHAARRHAGRHADGKDRRDRVRSHRRRRAHPDAAKHGPALGRPREHERSLSGALLHGGREQHLHRRPAAHHAQCRRQCRCGAVRQAGRACDGQSGRRGAGCRMTSFFRHAELVSASTYQLEPSALVAQWTLKQVQGDGLGEPSCSRKS
jgi:hypothetical protein